MALGEYSDVDQSYAVAIGYASRANGNSSIAFGRFDSTSATNAISIGYDAHGSGYSGINMGYQSAVEDSYSVALGHLAGANAKNSIAIGYTSTIAAGAENSIAIGHGASVSSSNEVYIGNSSIVSIGGVVNWTATSDARFKNNVKENVPGLDFIMNLRPVTYNMDVNAIEEFHGRTIDGGMRKHMDAKGQIVYTGFLAQEVEQAARDADYNFSGVDPPKYDGDAYGIRYAEFVVPLVKATQELNAKIEEQQAVISQQESTIKAYEAQLGKVETDYKEALLELTARLKALETEVQQGRNKQMVSR
ncbi:MAG: tail fiber domain-containing protein [Bacteroidota bacterium]